MTKLNIKEVKQKIDKYFATTTKEQIHQDLKTAGLYMSKLIFRPFNKETDFDAVLKMERECFQPYEAWTCEQYEAILDDPNLYFMVAYDGSALAGNTFAFVNQGDDKDITHLDNNVVSPLYRRRGLGNKFTEMRLQAGRDAGDKKAIVEVAIDNMPSILLLQSAGFTVYGRFPKYYRNEVDALLLHMYL